MISGTGDVVEPEKGAIAIGSGGNYALAAAMAYLDSASLSSREIAERSLRIASAGKTMTFKGEEITVEELS